MYLARDGEQPSPSPFSPPSAAGNGGNGGDGGAAPRSSAAVGVAGVELAEGEQDFRVVVRLGTALQQVHVRCSLGRDAFKRLLSEQVAAVLLAPDERGGDDGGGT